MRVISRSCIACHQKKDKRELNRLVRRPDGTIVVDSTGKMNGRGCYICKDEKCIEKAMKKDLSRALKTPIDNETRDELIRALEKE